MVETRSGRSVSPDPVEHEEELEERRGSPRKQEKAASSGGAAAAVEAAPRGRRPTRAGAAETGALSESQAYTLLAVTLALMALPMVFMPQLVRCSCC